MNDNLRTSGRWVKASASAPNGSCVMIRRVDGGYEVGDTKNPNGPTLRFDDSEMSSFEEGLRTGKWVDVK